MKLISESIEDIEYITEDDDEGKKEGIALEVSFFRLKSKIETVASIR